MRKRNVLMIVTLVFTVGLPVIFFLLRESQPRGSPAGRGHHGHEHPTGVPEPDRELDILDRSSSCLSNQVIAARMGINTETAQDNVSTVFLKLGAHDRVHAVAIALRRWTRKMR
jgi:DNA-binding NarL/FixJ family response regulator